MCIWGVMLFLRCSWMNEQVEKGNLFKTVKVLYESIKNVNKNLVSHFKVDVNFSVNLILIFKTKFKLRVKLIGLFS